MNRFILATCCLVLLGCGDDDNPVGTDTLAGIYPIQSMTLVVGGTTVTLSPPDVTGTLTLTQSLRYTVSFSAPSEGVAETDTGTYSSAGSTITLTSDQDGSTTTAQLSGNLITMSDSASDGGITVSIDIVFTRPNSGY